MIDTEPSIVILERYLPGIGAAFYFTIPASDK
jgi:hypothetical protein